ncbi:MAG TPA: ribbon-helix-helix protein, CopG family [Candidatus Saccharimonadales bacterium]|nr:ribbon-helix-helix protein, CopG family [Candidatus Saccharimonadales bacterium]
MTTQIINISLPKELVKKIDNAASVDYASRSEFIRQTIVRRLKAQDNDIWGELAIGADEVRASAKKAGYASDKDYLRAVKEVRSSTRKR